MEINEINISKKREALNKYIKEEAKKSKGGIKLCYILTLLFRILAIILGIGTIIYVVMISGYYVELMLLIITFGFPIGLSYLPATVYKASLGREYMFRHQENASFDANNFVYSYRDSRTGLSDQFFAFKIPYDKITEIKRDEKTKLLEISGEIILETYENNVLTDSILGEKMDFIDAYNIEVAEKIKEMMKE